MGIEVSEVAGCPPERLIARIIRPIIRSPCGDWKALSSLGILISGLVESLSPYLVPEADVLSSIGSWSPHHLVYEE